MAEPTVTDIYEANMAVIRAEERRGARLIRRPWWRRLLARR